ncbi:hypothetical protein HOH87_03575 [bacterium]|jgi:hypothetical protein|nr:hypothetical protein [bacterium]
MSTSQVIIIDEDTFYHPIYQGVSDSLQIPITIENKLISEETISQTCSVVIVDLFVPNCIPWLGTLMQTSPHLKGIVLTPRALSMEEDKLIFNLGITLLQKPFFPVDLSVKIQEFVHE